MKTKHAILTAVLALAIQGCGITNPSRELADYFLKYARAGKVTFTKVSHGMFASSRFALLAFGPLLLALLLPLGYLVPMAIGVTGIAMLGKGTGSLPATTALQAWAWVFGIGLTFAVSYVAGQWCHAAFDRLRSRGTA